jgi:hypothetical protein
VERGWLGASYIEAIELGHAGMSRMISIRGDIDNISPGTSTPSSEDDYLDRGPERNDRHGIGPVLLATYGVMTVRDIVE